MKALTLLMLTTLLPAPALALKPLALVYEGAGACIEDDADCSKSAAEVARKAGFRVKFINPEAIDKIKATKEEEWTAAEVKTIFAGAKVWVQPGGMANEAFETMPNKLRVGLKKFIREGGGYVGFCAGAFMATEYIGTGGGEGLGIVAGWTATYHTGFDLSPVKWEGELRKIYFEGGPYFYGFQDDKNVEVMATYETGAAASVRTVFGKGRVWVTGLHPEAPLKWTKDDDIEDPDGIEQYLAVDMIRWAGGRPPLSKKQR